jgi:hypothetical protein
MRCVSHGLARQSAAEDGHLWHLFAAPLPQAQQADAIGTLHTRAVEVGMRRRLLVN